MLNIFWRILCCIPRFQQWNLCGSGSDLHTTNLWKIFCSIIWQVKHQPSFTNGSFHLHREIQLIETHCTEAEKEEDLFLLLVVKKLQNVVCSSKRYIEIYIFFFLTNYQLILIDFEAISPEERIFCPSWKSSSLPPG